MSNRENTDTDRIPYGTESSVEMDDGTPLYIPRDSERCHDCQVEQGELHKAGCDVEQCPICLTQLLSCDHSLWSATARGDDDE